MKQRKLQVFVSSTYLDLKEERQAAVEAILMAGHIPAGMELFASEDKTQMEVIKKWIDESDVYLLILGGRYGSIDKESGKSYTHLEYDYAVENGKAYFAVVVRDEAQIERVNKNGDQFDEQDNRQKFRDFKATVTSKIVKYWSDSKDIQLSIIQTLSRYAEHEDLVGWVRADTATNIGPIAEELAKLSKENEQLRSKVALLESFGEGEQKYHGLTFEQMKNQLEAETIFEDQDHEGTYYRESLLDGLRSQWSALSRQLWEEEFGFEVIPEALTRFGIVQVGNVNGQRFFTLTPEGTRFCLRLKVETDLKQ